MTAIKASDVDRFISKPDPAQPILLIYGPDAGLVSERVTALVHVSVDDPNDPFILARLDGEELSANPSRLVEEAHTVPLFAGRRAVWVKAGARNIAPAVELVISAPPTDCRIIIEAGDLRKNAPLRTLCEKSKFAVALPCYVDNARDLTQLVDIEIRAANLTISSEARAMLLSLLGSNRLASRNEVRKLALYAGEQERIELSDIMAVVADASALALDAVIDAAFVGNTNKVNEEFVKARAAGSSPVGMISTAIRYVANLHKMQISIRPGSPIELIMKQATPPIHFSREKSISEALRIWTPTRLLRAMQQLAETSLDMRRNSILAEALALRSLLSIAVNARHRDS
jgi:DNA polymerase III subunit delta